jgi:phosphatidylethanolamine-binding protein (PEBP) family uncharacterized protein
LKKKRIQNKIYSNQKIDDQIRYNQQITRHSEFSTASGKCFSPKIKIKYFPENQAKFFFD